MVHQLKTPPSIIRNMDDDQEVIQMKGGNLQRKSILPRERVFARKMKIKTIKGTKNGIFEMWPELGHGNGQIKLWPNIWGKAVTRFGASSVL